MQHHDALRSLKYLKFYFFVEAHKLPFFYLFLPASFCGSKSTFTRLTSHVRILVIVYLSYRFPSTLAISLVVLKGVS